MPGGAEAIKAKLLTREAKKKADLMKFQLEQQKAKMEFLTDQATQDLMARAQAKDSVTALKEKAAKEKAKASGQKAEDEQLPFTTPNLARPESTLDPAAMENVPLAQYGAAGAQGGAAVQGIAQQGFQQMQGTGGGGSMGGFNVPSEIVTRRTSIGFQPTELAPGVMGTTPTAQTTIDRTPNVLTAGDVLRARTAQQVAQLKALGQVVKDEGTALGSLFLDAETSPEAREALEGKMLRLREQYGPLAGQILLSGQREAAKLRAKRREAEYKSDLISDRSAESDARARDRLALSDQLQREREKDREGRAADNPSNALNDRVAEIMLKIDREGPESLTPNERALLDEKQRLSFEDKIVRSVLGGAGGGGPRIATQDDINSEEEAYRRLNGKEPSASELKSWMVGRGFRFE